MNVNIIQISINFPFGQDVSVRNTNVEKVPSQMNLIYIH